MSVAVILGSAFRAPSLGGVALRAVPHPTPWGEVTLYALPDRADAWVVFRHGVPHRHLPHQIPWRAQAQALADRGCRGLLITSSVGVLDPALPLFTPLLAGDLLMPDNRLPSGEVCTMWPEPAPGQGHLVVEAGLFDAALGAQLEVLHGAPLPRVVFAYVPGPRTKTPAENALWAAWGAQVNSMSVGPELVLANELGVPTAALLIGHKYSGPARDGLDAGSIDESLVSARAAVEQLALRFLREGRGVAFGNRVHRL